MSLITFDTNKLGTLYLPFQAADSQTTWNDSDGQASLFYSQGSLYKLMNPEINTGGPSNITDVTGPITDPDLLDSIAGFTTTIAAQIQASDPSMATALTDWNNDIQSGTDTYPPTEVLTVNSDLRHDYGDGTYDQAEIVSSFVYCQPLQLALLMQHSIKISWASASDDPYEELLNFGSKSGDGADDLSSLLDMIAEGAAEAIPGLDVIADIGLVCSAVEKVGKDYIADTDDGGKLNFFGVLAHTLIRVASCVSPHSAPAAQMPVLQPGRLKANWFNTNDNSAANPTAQSGVFFGSYPGSSYTYGGNTMDTVYSQPYVVNMPELSWDQGSLPFVFVTVKVFSDSQVMNPFLSDQNQKTVAESEHLYGLICLVYSSKGNMVSATLQCPNISSTFVPVSSDWLRSPNPLVVNGDFASSVENAVASTTAVSAPSNQFTFVLPQLAAQIMAAMAPASNADYQWSTGQQPLINAVMTWHGWTEYDNGNSSSVAIQPDGTVISCFDYSTDPTFNPNASDVHANSGTLLSNNTVSWPTPNLGGNGKVDSGTWPTIGLNPTGNNNVLACYNGGSNNIYNEVGTVGSGPSVDFSSKSKDTVSKDGDHPSLYVGTDGVTVLFYAPGDASTAYRVGTFDGTTFTPGDEIAYQLNGTNVNGDYLGVVRDGNGLIVLEVHNSHQDLLYNLGELSSDKSSISWDQTGPYPLNIPGTGLGNDMDGGSHPHLTYCGNGLIVLTYDNAGQIYVAIGHLDASGMQWYITNLLYGKGTFPSVCAVPNQGQKVVMCLNSGGVNGDLHSVVGTFTLPT